jgi:hypothetical protein
MERNENKFGSYSRSSFARLAITRETTVQHVLVLEAVRSHVCAASSHPLARAHFRRCANLFTSTNLLLDDFRTSENYWTTQVNSVLVAAAARVARKFDGKSPSIIPAPCARIACKPLDL